MDAVERDEGIGDGQYRLADHTILEAPGGTQGKKRGGKGGAGAAPPGLSWHLDLCGVPDTRREYGVDGTGTRVAVIDTGANASHPGLHGRVTAHDYTRCSSGGDDEEGHGTHVCGVVHAVAPGAEVHSFRVFASGRRAAADASIAAALSDVLSERHGRFDVVNMSLGTHAPRQRTRELLLELNSRGVVVCCAAGNDTDHDAEGAPRFGSVGWPAHYNCTVAVGSVGSDGRRSPFSSTGPKIMVMAPGDGVWSCWKGGDGLACLSGTSMASPFVAGVMCLVTEACRKRGVPRPGHGELLHCLSASCSDMEEPGFDYYTGYGRIHPRRLLERVLSRPARYA